MFRLDVEEGALPETGPTLDEVATQLAQLTELEELLPAAQWERLREMYDLELSVMQPVRAAWQPLAILFGATQGRPEGISAQEQQKARQVASVFCAYMAALTDAALFCEALVDRCVMLSKKPPHLVPVIGGSFALVEVERMHLRLLATDDMILGLQCKSGCVGPQLRRSVAQHKKDLQQMNSEPAERESSDEDEDEVSK